MCEHVGRAGACRDGRPTDMPNGRGAPPSGSHAHQNLKNSGVLTGLARMSNGRPKLDFFIRRGEDEESRRTVAHLYTDGGAVPIKEGGKVVDWMAGWGACAFSGSAAPEEGAPKWKAYGPVVTDTTHKMYVGARRRTVNTGELTGLLRALQAVLKRPKVPGATYRIFSDSTYALGRALSSGRPRANRIIIDGVRKMVKKVRRKHGYRGVVLAHIKAHVGWHGNETADELATLGLNATETVEEGPMWMRIFEDGVT